MTKKTSPDPPQAALGASFYSFQFTEEGYLLLRIEAHELHPDLPALEIFRQELVAHLLEHPMLIADIRMAKIPNPGIIRWANQLLKEINHSIQAIGFIVESPLSSFIANLFIGVLKRSFPSRAFRDIRKAQDWLSTQAKKE